MKKYQILSLIFLLLTMGLNAEDQRISFQGKTIILHDDFTWEYASSEPAENSDQIILDKDASNTAVFTSRLNKFTLSIDPNEWSQTSSINDTAEFQFVNDEQTGFCLLMYDGLSVPLKNMEQVVISNAQRLDPYAEISLIENCLVNGVPGELLSYVCSLNGLEFTFYSFIASSKKLGTIQYSFFTLSSVFEDLKPSFQKAISGFELLD